MSSLISLSPFLEGQASSGNNLFPTHFYILMIRDTPDFIKILDNMK